MTPELLELRGLEVAAALLTVLLAALGFFSPAFKWVWRKLQSIASAGTYFSRISGEFQQVKLVVDKQLEASNASTKLLQQLLAEIRPNGGGSLRDAVDRIEKSQLTNMLRQQVVLTLSQDAYFETDATGSCIYVNHKWEELTGITNEESQGSGWLHGVHPDDLDMVQREWSQSVRDRRPFRLEFRYRNVHTEMVSHVLLRAAAVRDARGTLVGYIGNAAVLEQTA